jgi:hypothetical protein
MVPANFGVPCTASGMIVSVTMAMSAPAPNNCNAAVMLGDKLPATKKPAPVKTIVPTAIVPQTPNIHLTERPAASIPADPEIASGRLPSAIAAMSAASGPCVFSVRPSTNASGIASIAVPNAMALPLPGFEVSDGWETHEPHRFRSPAPTELRSEFAQLNPTAPIMRAAKPPAREDVNVMALAANSTVAAASNNPAAAAMVAAMARWVNGAKIPINAPTIIPEAEIDHQNKAEGRVMFYLYSECNCPRLYLLLFDSVHEIRSIESVESDSPLLHSNGFNSPSIVGINSLTVGWMCMAR